MKRTILINKSERIIINFLTKASHYKVLPALIKNSPCDHIARVCLKSGYVKLTNATKTGNIYVITPKGHKFIKENNLNKSNLKNLWEI